MTSPVSAPLATPVAARGRHTPVVTGDSAAGAALPWLIRLRWLALVAFLALPFGVAGGLTGGVSLAPFLVLIVAMAATNVALRRATRRSVAARPEVVGAVLVLDTVLLTGLLFLAGGSTNPGTVVYLVHITFAAVLLGPRWAWTVTALSIGGFGVLVLNGTTATMPGAHDHSASSSAFDSHVTGMWVAFAATSSLIAHFVSQVAGVLARREQELAEVRAQAGRNERLAALTTLAAGAAHELSTPLATIAVTAREIERTARQSRCPHEHACAGDAALIAREVGRCHRMLDEMSGRARGRALDARPLVVAAAFQDACRELPAADAARIEIHVANASTYPALPHDDLVRVFVALLRNALDASSGDARIALRAREDDEALWITVEDHGHGMNAEVLARVDEPFFTTKAPGQGLGLGVFLACSVAEQLGGSLQIDSTVGVGTTVTLRLPADQGTGG